MYRALGSNPPAYIYNVASNSTNLLTRNGNVQRVDYVPTCAE